MQQHEQVCVSLTEYKLHHCCTSYIDYQFVSGSNSRWEKLLLLLACYVRRGKHIRCFWYIFQHSTKVDFLCLMSGYIHLFFVHIVLYFYFQCLVIASLSLLYFNFGEKNCKRKKKMLVLTLKASYGMGLGYLRDYLSLISSAYPT